MEDIARFTSIDLNTVRRVMGVLVTDGTVTNHGEGTCARTKHIIPQAPRRRTEIYAGAELKPYTGRPGAMQAFSLPSVDNGQRIERKRPMLIGGKPDAVFHGLKR